MQSLPFKFGINLFEVIISIIIFGTVSTSLISITSMVESSFDKGMVAAEKSRLARVGSVEVSDKLRQASEIIFPTNPSSTISSYTVFKFFLTSSNEVTGKIEVNPDNQLIFYNCNPTTPYAEITAGPALLPLPLGENISSFLISYQQTDLASFSFFLNLDRSSGIDDGLTIRSKVKIRKEI